MVALLTWSSAASTSDIISSEGRGYELNESVASVVPVRSVKAYSSEDASSSIVVVFIK
jgi:hypothetical protein